MFWPYVWAWHLWFNKSNFEKPSSNTIHHWNLLVSLVFFMFRKCSSKKWTVNEREWAWKSPRTAWKAVTRRERPVKVGPRFFAFLGYRPEPYNWYLLHRLLGRTLDLWKIYHIVSRNLKLLVQNRMNYAFWINLVDLHSSPPMNSRKKKENPVLVPCVSA